MNKFWGQWFINVGLGSPRVMTQWYSHIWDLGIFKKDPGFKPIVVQRIFLVTLCHRAWLGGANNSRVRSIISLLKKKKSLLHNFRFHRLSFGQFQEWSLEQFKIGICLVNSKMKRSGIHVFSMLFLSTPIQREFSISDVHHSSSIKFELN